jgi:hypothetical protein
MRLTWKLLPLAAMFALGVFLFSLPSGARPVSATPAGTTTVNPASQPTIGGTALVSASYNDDQPSANPSSAVLTSTNAAVGIFLTGAATVSPINGEVVTVASTSVTVTEDADSVAATKTISATFICQAAGTTTFILTHGGTASSSNGTLTCGSGGGTGTATITASPSLLAQGAQGSFTATASTTVANQTIVISAQPAFVTFGTPNSLLNGLPSGDVWSQPGSTSLTLTATSVGTRTITGTFTCIQTGTVALTITVSGSSPAYSAAIVCGTGLTTPTVGPASSITVAASPTSVSCNGTAFVTVTVRNAAGGYVADGTSVTLTASMGSLSPTTATTLGGGVLAVFTAPGNQSGTATIQASAAGTATGNASITIACQSATPTPAAPPTIFVPPPAQVNPGTIAPPNTGDAGLAAGDSWRGYAGIAMVVVSVVASAAVVRRRA